MPLPKDPIKLAEYKKKMSEIALAKGYGKWMTGRKGTMLGKHHSEETKAILSKKFKKIAKEKGFGLWMSGREKTPFLLASKKVHENRKGKTYEDIYGEKASSEKRKRKIGNRKRFFGKILKNDIRPKHNGNYQYIEWRISVFARDNYIDQKTLVRGGLLEAHHIRSWASNPELRFEINNGITLSKDSHKEFHKKYGFGKNTHEQMKEFLNKES